jgi:hypothetical protein
MSTIWRRSSRAIVAVIVVATFGAPSTARAAGHDHDHDRDGVTVRHDAAQPVTDWSAIAQNATVAVAKRFPGEAALLMGIAHVAIFDATVAVEGGFTPYTYPAAAPAGTSLPATVATAAHDVLVTLFPEQRSGPAGLDATYAAYLATVADGPAKLDGVAVGGAVAATVIDQRADDGRARTVPYVQTPPGPGVYEPTAPIVLGTTLAQVDPLVLRSPSQFRPKGPPSVSGRRYARDFAEVRLLGRVDSSARTTAQTATALFWTDNDVAQWNRGLLRFIAAAGLDAARSAQLLALAHVAGGDAMIACFAAKFDERFWRPVQAIVQAGTDGNPLTAPDPTWTPLRPTPPFPEYPSAHACHSSAIVAAVGRVVAGSDVSLTLDSTVTGERRTYAHAGDIVTEVNDARVWAGFHFRSATEDGSTLGRRVGRFVAAHAFAPVDHDDD